MKILYHHRTRSKDGQSVHIDEMIGAFRELGHEVIIVAPAAAASESSDADTDLVAALRRYLPKFMYELMEFAYSFITYRQLAAAIKIHKPDWIYERYNLFLPAGIWIKRRFKLRLVLEVNSPLFEERDAEEGISLKRLARWSQSYAWRNADFVLPVTRVLADDVQAYGVDKTRIVVIPNGINAARFGANRDVDQAKRALGLTDTLVLGFTGFIREWHGLDKVIDLIAADPPGTRRHLLVVGDGPVLEKLRQQAARLGINSRVTFTGLVAHDQVAQYVDAFDIALQPAVVRYASPLKLFEYLALGKAIVAPNQPNIAEILTDGENALLFDPTDLNGMAGAIERLCGDGVLRVRIAEAAQSTISQQGLTWDDNAKQVIRLVERLD